MREQVIAKRYARALFSLGQEKGDKELKAYGQDLANLTKVLNNTPDLLRIFKNPVIRTEDKKVLLKKILEKCNVGKVVQNFCLFLADKGRLPNFLEIQDYYNRLLDIHEGILRGKLITAIDLPSAKQKKVKEQLEKQLAQNLYLEYEKNEDILGGLVLRVGDKIYDASLKAQLEQLKENIKRGE